MLSAFASAFPSKSEYLFAYVKKISYSLLFFIRCSFLSRSYLFCFSPRSVLPTEREKRPPPKRAYSATALFAAVLSTFAACWCGKPLVFSPERRKKKEEPIWKTRGRAAVFRHFAQEGRLAATARQPEYRTVGECRPYLCPLQRGSQF